MVDYLIQLLNGPPYRFNMRHFVRLCFLWPVFFAAKDSQETKALVVKYEKAMETIASYCSGKSILEVVKENL